MLLIMIARYPLLAKTLPNLYAWGEHFSSELLLQFQFPSAVCCVSSLRSIIQEFANCFIFLKVLSGVVLGCSDQLYVMKWVLAACLKCLQ